MRRNRTGRRTVAVEIVTVPFVAGTALVMLGVYIGAIAATPRLVKTEAGAAN